MKKHARSKQTPPRNAPHTAADAYLEIRAHLAMPPRRAPSSSVKDESDRLSVTRPAKHGRVRLWDE